MTGRGVFSELIFSLFADTGAAGSRARKRKEEGKARGQQKLGSQLELAVAGADSLSWKRRKKLMAVRTGCVPRCK